jgi:1-acyl-sn-glycerol-3-phosphate acyltransferase
MERLARQRSGKRTDRHESTLVCSTTQGQTRRISIHAAKRLARSAFGALSFLCVLLWLGCAGLPSILLLSVPASRVRPSRRLAWISSWARTNSRVVLGLLRLGGARYVRRGEIETDKPGIIVMNHQSLLDIPTAIVMSGPLVPAFVTRGRYGLVPMIATGIRLADCPVIDPRQDREGAVATLRRAVWQERALLIYPEGHRSEDGELQPFRSAGLLAMLGERRVPVWLVATDGFRAGRRLIDFVLHVHRIRGRTELVGRYQPPADAEELPAFVEFLQAELAARLAEMRGTERG